MKTTAMTQLRNDLIAIWNNDGKFRYLTPFSLLLYSLSLLYGGIVRFRNFLYDSGFVPIKRLPCPVIAVGNLTVGGTGKTPMTIFLANVLQDAGYRPAILSRGYGRKRHRSIAVVSDGNRLLMNPVHAGDEPFLMALSTGVPVLTGADRFSTGQCAVTQLNADILLLDDAFQHRCVFRDLNILLLDAKQPFGNGFLLPRGPLREPHRSLGRADLIVLTRADKQPETTPGKHTLEGVARQTPFFRAVHRPKAIVSLSNIREKAFASHNTSYLSPDFIQYKKVFAFAGIAKPDTFKNTVESLGAELAAFRGFSDHHIYTSQDIDAIRRLARQCRAEIILTTEKDGVKLRDLGRSLSDIYLLQIEMAIVREEEFTQAILKKLKR
jgi:tetraacyldisaccharide 4'-kinase